MSDPIQRRKEEHLELAAAGDVESRRGAGWDDVQLPHASLPEIDLAEVDCSQSFLNARLRFPVMIAGMTGGFDRAGEVNRILASAAESFGIAFGVGSQRAALSRAGLAGTYEVARRAAPSAFLIANIGAPQLIQQNAAPALSLEQVQEAVRMIEANALAVHLNYLQETIQPEGDRKARGCAQAIARLCAELRVPVIAKETGGGMTRDTARTIKDLGVAAIDVGGRGGTSFAAVEGIRAAAQGQAPAAKLGNVFRDWGIPTPVAVTQATGMGLPVIATGGVRTGLDAARAIVLGASLVGIGRPLVQCALQGPDAVAAWLERFVAGLRTAMFLTGARTVDDLRSRRPVILGQTLEWIRQLSPVYDTNG